MADDRYVVAVTCIVLYRNVWRGELEALIVKRGSSEQEGPGLWSIPGGRIERRDWGSPRITDDQSCYWEGALRRAMIREIREETGIKAPPITLLAEQNCIFERDDDQKTPTLVLQYAAVLEKKPRIVLGDELEEHRWVKQQELSQYPFIGNVGHEIYALMERLNAR